MPQRVPIAVACLVLLDPDDAVLAARRPRHKTLGGLWEFPGGKLDPGESAEAALRREIREELRLQLGTVAPLAPVEHRYEFATIRLLPFLSRCLVRPELQPTEHDEVLWISIDDAERLQWTPADIPILEALKRGAMTAPRR
ncbi:MAG: (deoxy)nucleoside triphosphate pyrophosphohydrolase [Gammaproteobacteria bacterium]|nr:(deoxy)nucleoside triphosphate pyrophosphohydrolase [Gammaproteobacteria bacterium]